MIVMILHNGLIVFKDMHHLNSITLRPSNNRIAIKWNYFFLLPQSLLQCSMFHVTSLLSRVSKLTPFKHMDTYINTFITHGQEHVFWVNRQNAILHTSFSFVRPYVRWPPKFFIKLNRLSCINILVMCPDCSIFFVLTKDDFV